jgi:glycosyltransferase involved in cell wall biosynthesis
MCVIRNGLAQRPPLEPSVRNDVRRELGIAVDAPVVGHVGRFNWQKNHRVLIEAAQRLVETRASVRFVLVGDGELRSQIEQQARDVGLRKHVILTGWRSDVSRLLSAMDVFAFPSKCEAFGLAAIEAQAAGLPVAASNLPGIREALAPEFVRYTVRHDDAAALASSIDALLKRSRTDAQLSAAARVFAARFSAEATRDAMLAAWRRGEARDSSESAPRRSVATDPAGAALARSALVGAAGR